MSWTSPLRAATPWERDRTARVLRAKTVGQDDGGPEE